MEPLFICPAPEVLETIPEQECAEIIDQIDMMLLQIIQDAPSFTAATILLQATWSPLMAANDATKVVKSPYLPNVVIPRGEILKEGGNDNSTINGIPKLNGRSFVGVTMELHNANRTIRAAFRKMASQSALQPGVTRIWAYFVNRFGQIIANADGSGFPVYNVMVGDPGTDGFNKDTIANLSFDLAPGWADNMQVFTPAAGFNPHRL